MPERVEGRVGRKDKMAELVEAKVVEIITTTPHPQNYKTHLVSISHGQAVLFRPILKPLLNARLRLYRLDSRSMFHLDGCVQ